MPFLTTKGLTYYSIITLHWRLWACVTCKFMYKLQLFWGRMLNNLKQIIGLCVGSVIRVWLVWLAQSSNKGSIFVIREGIGKNVSYTKNESSF